MLLKPIRALFVRTRNGPIAVGKELDYSDRCTAAKGGQNMISDLPCWTTQLCQPEGFDQSLGFPAAKEFVALLIVSRGMLIVADQEQRHTRPSALTRDSAERL